MSDDVNQPGDAKPIPPRESLVCPHCMEPVEAFDHLCPHCGGPVTAHASIDPMYQIWSMGYMYRRVIGTRPKFIVLLGMWLILGPQVLVLLAGFLLLLYNLGLSVMGQHAVEGSVSIEPGNPWAQLLVLPIVGGLAYIYGNMLGRVTWGYFRFSRRHG